MQNSLVESLIGAAVIAVAAVFLVFAYTSTGTSSVNGYPVLARFSRVDGVTTGTDVRLSGIKVGTVSELDLDTKNNFAAVAHLIIKDDVALPDDSAIRITSDGLLGGAYLAIEPGGSEKAIPRDGKGRIENTQGSIDLISLIQKAMFGGTSPKQ